MRRTFFESARGASGLAELTRGVVPAAAFLPSDLAGLVGWYETAFPASVHEAAAGGNPAETADVVQRWEDLSGNGRHLTNAAATTPVFTIPVSPYTGAPNGKPSIDYNSATGDQFLDAGAAADWSCLHDGTGCTCFVAFKGADENLGVLLDTGGLAGTRGATFYYDEGAGVEGRVTLAIRAAGANIINMSSGTTANAAPAGQWHLACFDFGGTTARSFLNDCFFATATGTPQTGAPTAPLRVGLDKDGGDTLRFSGSIAAAIVYNRVLADSERRRVAMYLGLQYGIAIGNVACLGDSITAGGGIVATPYPTALAGRLGSQWRTTNFGVSGAQTDAIKTNQWDSVTAGARRRRYNYVVHLGGINDIRGGLSGAQTFNNAGRVKDTFDSILADPGNRLVACTLIPNKSDTGYNAARQTEIDALNALVRDYVSTHANSRLVDLATLLANPADPLALRPAYDLDHLHPNQAGTDAIAAAVADTLLAMGLGL